MKEIQARLLNAVKTPLGFFSLVILVGDGLLFAVLFRSPAQMRSIVVVAMIVLLFFTTLIVAILCFMNPRSLGTDTHSKQKGNGHQLTKAAAGYAKYEGHYECYHKSTVGDQKVIRSYAHITFGAADEPVRFESFRYKYKGTFTLDDNSIYLFLDGDGQYRARAFHPQRSAIAGVRSAHWRFRSGDRGASTGSRKDPVV